VQIIVAIIGPRSMPQKHLAALAGVSRVLRDESKRAELIAASDDAHAYRALAEL
jgi:mannitol/fructose-specific phosphotransferase system IIA component (Ntr-type)